MTPLELIISIAHILIVIFSGLCVYTMFRLIEKKIDGSISVIKFLALVSEVIFIYAGGFNIYSMDYNMMLLVGGGIGGKLHMYSGGYSKKLSDAFHLLCLSSVVSYVVSSHFTLRFFLIQLSSISPVLLKIMVSASLISPMIAALLCSIIYRFRSPEKLDTDDYVPIAKA